IGLEMTKADPPDRGGIDQCGHGVAHGRKQPLHAGVIQQRLLIAHEKLIELEIALRNKRGDPINIGGDFGDLGHRFSSYVFTNLPECINFLNSSTMPSRRYIRPSLQSPSAIRTPAPFPKRSIGGA